MYRYSVIIPVYNAEQTISRCLDSLLNQPHNQAEIIVVNDGSRDRSGEICRSYASADDHVHYYAQENAGVSSARNKGISVASGTYILFVDSDDYVAGDYFESLDRLLASQNADLVVFSEYHVKNGQISRVTRQPFFTAQAESLYPKISELICKKVISGPVTKIYKRSVIEEYGIRFPEKVSITEDRTFNIKYALHIGSVMVSEAPLYYVSLDNESSLSRRKDKQLEEQSVIARRDLDAALESCGLSAGRKQFFVDALNFGACRVVYTYAKMFWKNGDPAKERRRKIKQLCREINSHRYTYPKTLYCFLISLPVRLNLVWLIDLMAWKLTH